MRFPGEVEKSKIASENAPAPSFNTLVSTGCTSASDDLRRQFWEAWEDRGLFSAISGEAVLNERLKKRLDILVQQGESGMSTRAIANGRYPRRAHGVKSTLVV